MRLLRRAVAFTGQTPRRPHSHPKIWNRSNNANVTQPIRDGDSVRVTRLGYGLECPLFDPGRNKTFFSSSKRPDRLWRPPNLQFNVYLATAAWAKRPLTTDLPPGPRLRTSGSIPLLLFCAFMTCTETSWRAYPTDYVYRQPCSTAFGMDVFTRAWARAVMLKRMRNLCNVRLYRCY